jgi:acetylornithine deacetylase
MRTGATPGETVSDEAILEAVAAEAGWMEDLLVRLVEAPTTLGDEEAGQRIMEQALADCGLEPRSVYLGADTLRGAEGASPFSWDVKAKRNVVAGWSARGSGGRSLILNGHVDVVPPAAEALWTNPPFRAVPDGDWLYGRGAGDMKAGLAAMTGAVRALKSAGYDPAANVQLQSVVEEECTGHGTVQCLLDGARGEGIHGIDERVSRRSVVESAQVLGLFVRDWCGLVPGRKEES